jgi:death-on-curing protein
VSASKEPRWLTRAIIESIHIDQLRQHGGSFGTRDGALLESALGRPRNRWHYKPEVGMNELGAAYGYGIAKNHPFIDGDKRTAFQAMYVFMGLNGWRIRMSEEEVVSTLEGVAAGGIDETGLADWLREHLVRWRRRRT